MPRPQIDEELHAKVRQIHTQIEGDSPESFQEALETVVSLALGQAEKEGKPLEDWYLGKNVERAYKTFRSTIGEDSHESAANGDEKEKSHQKSSQPNYLPGGTTSIDLDQLESTAVFKTELNKDGSALIPPAERRAAQLSEGDLLQVIAKRIEENSRDDIN